MGGIFGVVSKNNCITDLYFGTDYHSHLGSSRGGMAVWDKGYISKAIHNIESIQFRTKFEGDLPDLTGKMGIGCISDLESQPLTVYSHLGRFALTTVGRINNIDEIVADIIKSRTSQFIELSMGRINSTEVFAALLNSESTFSDGIRKIHETVDGSCTLMILTKDGIYAARDKMGRTPLVLGYKDGAFCATSETSAFPNLGYRTYYELGPGEVVLMTAEGIEQIIPPSDEMKICAFLWVYYGFSASTYEGVNVEKMRYRSGAAFARRDDVDVDLVAGIPDSGVPYAIGYANESKFPYGRPFIKYTPTWARSFLPTNPEIREMVSRMKLLPVEDLIRGQRILFCDDSIVRGTQLGDTAKLLYASKAAEVHMRPSSPPLLYSCKYLSFFRLNSEDDLITRRIIRELEGHMPENIADYTDPESERYQAMLQRMKEKLNFTSLKYQTIPCMVKSIGIDPCKICTYCWSGKDDSSDLYKC